MQAVQSKQRLTYWCRQYLMTWKHRIKIWQNKYGNWTAQHLSLLTFNVNKHYIYTMFASSSTATFTGHWRKRQKVLSPGMKETKTSMGTWLTSFSSYNIRVSAVLHCNWHIHQYYKTTFTRSHGMHTVNNNLVRSIHNDIKYLRWIRLCRSMSTVTDPIWSNTYRVYAAQKH